jgi:hypothetical protein
VDAELLPLQGEDKGGGTSQIITPEIHFFQKTENKIPGNPFIILSIRG